MFSVVLVLHLLILLALIAVVLLQRSEGGALGIGGGGGGGGGLMSGRGAANALTHTTAWLAAGFFATSISLSVIAGMKTSKPSLIDKVIEAPATTGAPVTTPEVPMLPEVPVLPPAEPSVPTPQ